MLIEIPRGDYRQIYLSLDLTSGDPLDLAENEDIILTIKKNYDTKNIIFQKSIYEGTMVKDVNEEGQIKYVFDLNPEDTINLRYGNYVGDLKIVKNTDTNPEPETLDLVKIKVTKEATNISTDYDIRYEEKEEEIDG